MIVYNCFNNPFIVDYGSLYFNLTSTPIDDSPHLNKRSRYTSDLIPASIYTTSGKSVGTLTNPY